MRICLEGSRRAAGCGMAVWMILAMVWSWRVEAAPAEESGGKGVEARSAPEADVSLEGSSSDRMRIGDRTGAVAGGWEEHRLEIRWSPDETTGSGGERRSATLRGEPRVIASTDAPGHWAVRDWRAWPMVRTGGGWVARIPLISAETPVVYFLEHAQAGETASSGMRCFRPRVAGVDRSSTLFSGHLDGFEQGMVGWEWGGHADGAEWMTVTTNAWSGRQALRVQVPAGRASATVGTVRVRGWMLTELSVRKIAIVLRSDGGGGRVRITLHGDARTEKLAVYPARTEFDVGAGWRRLEVPVDDFVNLRPATVDWMTVQFLAEAGRSLLLDDLELVLR